MNPIQPQHVLMFYTFITAVAMTFISSQHSPKCP